jgi:hypothetical protein
VGFYAADAFNENVPPSDDPDFLRASSAAVFGVRSQRTGNKKPAFLTLKLLPVAYCLKAS